MIDKIVEIEDYIHNYIFSSRINYLFLDCINYFNDKYNVVVGLDNILFFSHIKINYFYNMRIRYLLPNIHKEFIISIDHVQVKSFFENKIVFIASADCAVPQLHLRIFNWIESKLKEKNDRRKWALLDKNNKFLWLRLNYYFYKSNIYNYPSQKNNICIINGLFCKSKLDFLCELGESLFGVNGYVGSDLDGLHDSLTGGIGVIFSGLSIVWINYNYSKIMMGNDFDEILDIIKSIGYIKIILR